MKLIQIGGEYDDEGNQVCPGNDRGIYIGKIYVNEGTWIDDYMDDPENTASFAEIDSDAQETAVQLLKCMPDAAGGLKEIVPVQNQYVEN